MNRPLRVAAVHTSFSLYWPARLNALSRRLQETGGELHIVEVTSDAGPYVFANGSSQDAANGRTVRLFGDDPMASLKPATIASRIWDVLESIQPDVVIAGAIAFTPGATAVRWSRSRKRGVVIMDDARLIDVPRSVAINAIKRRVYANVDAMFVPAPSHLETFRFFGIAPDNIFFGVDVVDNEVIAKAVDTLRAKQIRTLHGFEFPERCFVGVGRQVAVKNWPFLLNAYARYREITENPWDLVLVGEGVERQRIESLIADKKIRGIHLRPFCSPQEMPFVFANASCVILPSVSEPWGLVVNEAMASGLPVLVSIGCGCASTLVRGGINGWTFSPGDLGQLASRLRDMSASDCAARQRMGDASRNLIADWSIERFASGACEAIQRCATVRRGFAGPADRLLFSLWKGRFRPV